MENTHIEWADHTFNPWIGCTKVSPGCQHCYAEARDLRFAQGKHWGKGAPRVRTSAANWRQPLKWNKELICDSCGERGVDAVVCCGRPMRKPRVFCASLADWLDDEVLIEWRADLLKLIHDTPNLDWLMVTKRLGNWSALLHDAFRHDVTGDLDWLSGWLDGDAPDNIWIGATVEDQARADERIPQLLAIPAKVRFLSCEPLLEAVRIEEWLISHSRARADLHERRTGHDCGAAAMVFTCDECGLTTFSEKDQRIHWVICGGESGPGARPMHPDWARSLRDQCNAAGVPFFFKQWGSNCVGSQMTTGGIQDEEAWDDHVYRLKNKKDFRELDGREWNEVPA